MILNRKNDFSSERDPNSALPPPMIGGSRPTVIGEQPPPLAGLEDLCPPPPKCQNCQAFRCEGSARMYGLNVLPYDTVFPGLPNRTSGKQLIILVLILLTRQLPRLRQKPMHR